MRYCTARRRLRTALPEICLFYNESLCYRILNFVFWLLNWFNIEMNCLRTQFNHRQLNTQIFISNTQIFIICLCGVEYFMFIVFFILLSFISYSFAHIEFNWFYLISMCLLLSFDWRITIIVRCLKFEVWNKRELKVVVKSFHENINFCSEIKKKKNTHRVTEAGASQRNCNNKCIDLSERCTVSKK